MRSTIPSSWSDYCGQLRSMFDEHFRAIEELGKVVSNLSSERYCGKTSLSDENFDSIRVIMDHVIGSAHVYADYLSDAVSGVGSEPQEHSYTIDSPESAIQSLREAFARMPLALKPAKDFTEEQLAAIKFSVRWGQEYDVEQMIEHAIVHILRHRRQLRFGLNCQSALFDYLFFFSRFS